MIEWFVKKPEDTQVALVLGFVYTFAIGTMVIAKYYEMTGT